MNDERVSRHIELMSELEARSQDAKRILHEQKLLEQEESTLREGELRQYTARYISWLSINGVERAGVLTEHRGTRTETRSHIKRGAIFNRTENILIKIPVERSSVNYWNTISTNRWEQPAGYFKDSAFEHIFDSQTVIGQDILSNTPGIFRQIKVTPSTYGDKPYTGKLLTVEDVTPDIAKSTAETERHLNIIASIIATTAINHGFDPSNF